MKRGGEPPPAPGPPGRAPHAPRGGLSSSSDKKYTTDSECPRAEAAPDVAPSRGVGRRAKPCGSCAVVRYRKKWWVLVANGYDRGVTHRVRVLVRLQNSNDSECRARTENAGAAHFPPRNGGELKPPVLAVVPARHNADDPEENQTHLEQWHNTKADWDRVKRNIFAEGLKRLIDDRRDDIWEELKWQGLLDADMTQKKLRPAKRKTLAAGEKVAVEVDVAGSSRAESATRGAAVLRYGPSPSARSSSAGHDQQETRADVGNVGGPAKANQCPRGRGLLDADQGRAPGPLGVDDNRGPPPPRPEGEADEAAAPARAQCRKIKLTRISSLPQHQHQLGTGDSSSCGASLSLSSSLQLHQGERLRGAGAAGAGVLGDHRPAPDQVYCSVREPSSDVFAPRIMKSRPHQHLGNQNRKTRAAACLTKLMQAVQQTSRRIKFKLQDQGAPLAPAAPGPDVMDARPPSINMEEEAKNTSTGIRSESTTSTACANTNSTARSRKRIASAANCGHHEDGENYKRQRGNVTNRIRSRYAITTLRPQEGDAALLSSTATSSATQSRFQEMYRSAFLASELPRCDEPGRHTAAQAVRNLGEGEQVSSIALHSTRSASLGHGFGYGLGREHGSSDSAASSSRAGPRSQDHSLQTLARGAPSASGVGAEAASSTSTNATGSGDDVFFSWELTSDDMQKFFGDPSCPCSLSSFAPGGSGLPVVAESSASVEHQRPKHDKLSELRVASTGVKDAEEDAPMSVSIDFLKSIRSSAPLRGPVPRSGAGGCASFSSSISSRSNKLALHDDSLSFDVDVGNCTGETSGDENHVHDEDDLLVVDDDETRISRVVDASNEAPQVGRGPRASYHRPATGDVELEAVTSDVDGEDSSPDNNEERSPLPLEERLERRTRRLVREFIEAMDCDEQETYLLADIDEAPNLTELPFFRAATEAGIDEEVLLDEVAKYCHRAESCVSFAFGETQQSENQNADTKDKEMNSGDEIDAAKQPHRAKRATPKQNPHHAAAGGDTMRRPKNVAVDDPEKPWDIGNDWSSNFFGRQLLFDGESRSRHAVALRQELQLEHIGDVFFHLVKRLQMKQQRRGIYDGGFRNGILIGPHQLHGAMADTGRTNLARFIAKMVPLFLSLTQHNGDAKAAENFTYTHAQINFNADSPLHVDDMNVAGTKTMIITFGDFEGGQFFEANARGAKTIIADRDAVQPDGKKPYRVGDVVRGHAVDVKCRPHFFDGPRVAHKNLPWKAGDRVALILFTRGVHAYRPEYKQKVSAAVASLLRLGWNLPVDLRTTYLTVAPGCCANKEELQALMSRRPRPRATPMAASSRNRNHDSCCSAADLDKLRRVSIVLRQTPPEDKIPDLSVAVLDDLGRGRRAPAGDAVADRGPAPSPAPASGADDDKHELEHNGTAAVGIAVQNVVGADTPCPPPPSAQIAEARAVPFSASGRTSGSSDYLRGDEITVGALPLGATEATSEAPMSALPLSSMDDVGIASTDSLAHDYGNHDSYAYAPLGGEPGEKWFLDPDAVWSPRNQYHPDPPLHPAESDSPGTFEDEDGEHQMQEEGQALNAFQDSRLGKGADELMDRSEPESASPFFWLCDGVDDAPPAAGAGTPLELNSDGQQQEQREQHAHDDELQLQGPPAAIHAGQSQSLDWSTMWQQDCFDFAPHGATTPDIETPICIPGEVLYGLEHVEDEKRMEMNRTPPIAAAAAATSSRPSSLSPRPPPPDWKSSPEILPRAKAPSTPDASGEGTSSRSDVVSVQGLREVGINLNAAENISANPVEAKTVLASGIKNNGGRSCTHLERGRHKQQGRDNEHERETQDCRTPSMSEGGGEAPQPQVGAATPMVDSALKNLPKPLSASGEPFYGKTKGKKHTTPARPVTELHANTQQAEAPVQLVSAADVAARRKNRGGDPVGLDKALSELIPGGGTSSSSTSSGGGGGGETITTGRGKGKGGKGKGGKGKDGKGKGGKGKGGKGKANGKQGGKGKGGKGKGKTKK